MLDRLEDVLIEPFLAYCSVEAFDIGVLSWLARLNAQDPSPNALAQTLEELATAICARHGVTVAEIVAPGRGRLYARVRAEVGLAAIERGLASNAELARFFGRSQSNMSYAIGRLRQRLRVRRRKTV